MQRGLRLSSSPLRSFWENSTTQTWDLQLEWPLLLCIINALIQTGNTLRNRSVNKAMTGYYKAQKAAGNAVNLSVMKNVWHAKMLSCSVNICTFAAPKWQQFKLYLFALWTQYPGRWRQRDERELRSNSGECSFLYTEKSLFTTLFLFHLKFVGPCSSCTYEVSLFNLSRQESAVSFSQKGLSLTLEFDLKVDFKKALCGDASCDHSFFQI